MDEILKNPLHARGIARAHEGAPFHTFFKFKNAGEFQRPKRFTQGASAYAELTGEFTFCRQLVSRTERSNRELMPNCFADFLEGAAAWNGSEGWRATPFFVRASHLPVFPNQRSPRL